MPSGHHVYTRGDDASEHDPTDSAGGNRFNGNAEATRVFVFGGQNAFDCDVAHKTCQLRRTDFWITQRRSEANTATDRDRLRSKVMDTNRRGVPHMRASATATRQSIATDRIGSRQQPIVFSGGNGKLVARLNASGHCC